ncbi:uncharacterized protein LOC119682866 [Teleopsis dalmanni]|uniref:uncharacterized protein LOC119681625 n=1 Tax=Teleopsis dalmanni TaxID=139649 RepID=UPI0018CFDF83|nr:uncharacterized protein LOC119681625 [Teleopsis dalmanni]XP_037952324.1 uncharacterized protein LOC119682866 [Teleopsis dalmanni]
MSLQLQIPKLKGPANYRIWSMTVRAYLESEDLWNVVQSTPSDRAGLRKESRARYILLCLIEDEVFNELDYLESAERLWDYLKFKYEY